VRSRRVVIDHDDIIQPAMRRGDDRNPGRARERLDDSGIVVVPSVDPAAFDQDGWLSRDL
jgi:hypothetical protein